jgi:hypothetical protein
LYFPSVVPFFLSFFLLSFFWCSVHLLGPIGLPRKRSRHKEESCHFFSNGSHVCVWTRTVSDWPSWKPKTSNSSEIIKYFISRCILVSSYCCLPLFSLGFCLHPCVYRSYIQEQVTYARHPCAPSLLSRTAVPPDCSNSCSILQSFVHERNLSPSTDIDFTFRDYYIDEALVRPLNEQNSLEMKCDAA